MMMGKLPPKIDARTFKLEALLDESVLPTPPSVLDRSDLHVPWGMMLNDKVGDCTVAAIAHIEQLWSSGTIMPSDEDVMKAYSTVSGYDPAKPFSDVGASMLDVMNYWRTTGIAGRTIEAYAKIATHGHLRVSIFLFGAVNGGLQLPVSCCRQKVWYVADSRLLGAASPGSWGLHGVAVIGFNEIGPLCLTWGRVQQMTWKFWDAYADEAYVPFSEEGLDKAPQGFDRDKLLACLQAL